MKDNRMDDVVAGVAERASWARQRLTKDWKNVKPFNKVPVDDAVISQIYQSMTVEDMDYIISTYGREVVNQRLYEVEMMLRRKQNA